MIFWLLFFTMVLLTSAEFGFVLSFKHPKFIARFLKVSHKSRIPKIIFGVSMPVFLLMLYLLLKYLSTPQPNPAYHPQTIQQTGQNSAVPNINDYTELNKEDFKVENNYSFLYTGLDKSEKTLEKTAQYIKSTTCQGPCTIYFYDDIKAYNEDRARATITSDQVMQDWNKTNYIYVADHFLGYLSSNPGVSFTYYPYKDWYYVQQKSIQTPMR